MSISSDRPAGAPAARVGDRVLVQLPLDLYIPPDALSVLLTEFEGPLDLLLYLIRKQNLDLLNISVAEVTRQYLAYLSLMQAMNIELAAEYLLMAAWLTEIKSRLLLPAPPVTEAEEAVADPRVVLIERLRAYEQVAGAARWLDEQPQAGRDFFMLSIEAPFPRQAVLPPVLSLPDLTDALRSLMAQRFLTAAHEIRREVLSVRARMSELLAWLAETPELVLQTVFRPAEGAGGVAVSLVAVLELAKLSAIEVAQEAPFAPVRLWRQREADACDAL
ncbi:segregation and condensation protein A [Halothiobacillus sp. DCM-1]|uniref:segregation and condensation protein A n=1 Tax=Halothiobacillus sp. DCM-1 TaxID=3112558 RepID=UPI0032491A53